MKKEKHARKLKEELNVRRILCCYDDSNNGGLNDECLSPGSCAGKGECVHANAEDGLGGSSSDGGFVSSTYFERMSLPLMDTSDEDIACVLYDAFDFMLSATSAESACGRRTSTEGKKKRKMMKKKKMMMKKVGVSCTVKWAVRVRSLFASRLSCGEKV